MKTNRLLSVLFFFTVIAGGCVATTTSSQTWGPGAYQPYVRYGRVEFVREIVQRQDGDPVGGAIVGAVIGGMIGGRGPGAVVGAVGGAAIGAAASQGHSERRSYEIHVYFDDGGRQAFVYADYAPFQPGQPVVLTDQGLRAI
ncbi:MAG: glycine zipper domain-containing protein [Myxococcales bacterium]